MRECYSADAQQMLLRICGEFMEMPGLRLTLPQARRLWGLDEDTCGQMLRALIGAGFLQKTGADIYVRVTDGPVPLARLRQVTASFTPSESSAR